MDAYVSRTPRTESPQPPSGSVDLHQIEAEIQPNSPAPPPSQTLDDRLNSSPVDSSSNSVQVSPSNVETLVDQSDSTFLPVICIQEDAEEEPVLQSSPDRTVSTSDPSYWSSTCAERPESWYSAGGTKAYASHWAEPWSSLRETDTETGPSVESEVKPFMVGAGLANLGNTCFLNAVLQCFTHTVPLLQGLCSCGHVMPCDRDKEGYCVLCALRGQIEYSLAYMGGVVSPFKLVDNLSYFSSSFRRYQQEDAHEFLQCLLDRLDSCYDDLKKTNITSFSEDDNLVKQVFGGRLISKLRCCNCSHCSDTYEPLIDLSLEIEDVDTLPSALESFTKVEKIEDAEKFTCENCKEEVSVEKQLMLDQLPSVAAFHLKRFKNYGSYVEKIDRHVQFPLELDLLPYTNGCQDESVDLKYNLYAIVVHTGFSSTSGHYYCFIRTAPETWYRLDDSKVTRVREEFVLSQEAYILFYAKQGTPWFSSFIETQKPPSLYTKTLHTSPKSVLDNVDNNCMPSTSLANNHTCEVEETRDAADRASSQPCFGSRDGVEVFRAINFSQRYGTVATEASNSHDATSLKVEKNSTPSPLGEYNCNISSGKAKRHADVTLQTPPRSPSPDIYCEEPPELSYHVLLPQQSKSSSQRQLNKDSDDPMKKQACKLLKKMPNSRGAQLLAAMRGSHSEEPSVNKKRSRVVLGSSNTNDDHHRGTRSEGSMNKKKTRKGSSPNSNDDYRSSDRVKANLSSFMSPVAAGNFR